MRVALRQHDHRGPPPPPPPPRNTSSVARSLCGGGRHRSLPPLYPRSGAAPTGARRAWKGRGSTDRGKARGGCVTEEAGPQQRGRECQEGAGRAWNPRGITDRGPLILASCIALAQPAGLSPTCRLRLRAALAQPAGRGRPFKGVDSESTTRTLTDSESTTGHQVSRAQGRDCRWATFQGRRLGVDNGAAETCGLDRCRNLCLVLRRLGQGDNGGEFEHESLYINSSCVDSDKGTMEKDCRRLTPQLLMYGPKKLYKC